MASLTSLYRITDENLRLRHGFMRFDRQDVATLAQLRSWADQVAQPLVHEFYQHQFQYSESRAYLEHQARRMGVSMDQLRAVLEKAQAEYFRQIFEEAASGGKFGANYFERRLFVGRLHNKIDLPLKWYIGSYTLYFDLVRKYLARGVNRFRPGFRARAERAILTVFNFDIQAIVEAFYYDTFASMGADLASIAVSTAKQDLSDQGAALKGPIRESLMEMTRASRQLGQISAQLAEAAEQVRSAVDQVAHGTQQVAANTQTTSESARGISAAVDQLSQAIDQIAQGASDQAGQVQGASAIAVEMSEGVGRVADDANRVTAASAQTKAAAALGVQAVKDTVQGMAQIQTVVSEAARSVQELGNLGKKIGAVVDTIDDIAEQTNLLALNAAIEAARAGEHGKGFAVVADEVRKLAERSGRETKAIAELIRQVQDGTQAAVRAMETGSSIVAEGSTKAQQAGETLGDILRTVEESALQAAGIATASRQMASSSGRVSDAMQSISAVVEENTAATEEMAAQAGQVARSIQHIVTASEDQSASTEEVSASAEQMSAQIHEVSLQARELATTADRLKELAGRFIFDEDRPEQLPPANVVKLRRAAAS
jgi:methyl-accepting chemotaxis protein